MAKLAVLLALLVSEARNSSAASLIGFVETPVSVRENRPGSTLPSVVIPTNGCASAASARASVWVTNGFGGDGRCRPGELIRARMPNGIAIVGVAIFSPRRRLWRGPPPPPCPPPCRKLFLFILLLHPPFTP